MLRQGHLVVFIFAIQFVSITVVWCPYHGEFMSSFSNILFMAYHTSNYIYAIVCVCHILVQLESFISWCDLETRGATDFFTFFHSNYKVHSACEARSDLIRWPMLRRCQSYCEFPCEGRYRVLTSLFCNLLNLTLSWVAIEFLCRHLVSVKQDVTKLASVLQSRTVVTKKVVYLFLLA